MFGFRCDAESADSGIRWWGGSVKHRAESGSRRDNARVSINRTCVDMVLGCGSGPGRGGVEGL